MASPHEQQWWPSFVQGLKERPLAELAGGTGLSEDELVASLVAASVGGRAEEEPWWPEALRLVTAGRAIRETARRFGTEARRLRRALTRSGVRAGGVNLGKEGIEALVLFRDRLGQEPDGAIAREAGTTVEAVQGERRRLGIPPFRLRPDEEEWEDEPPPPPVERPRGRRRWDELPVPEVIRRRTTAGEGRLPEAGPGIALAPRGEVRGRVLPEPPVRPAVEEPPREAAPDPPGPTIVADAGQPRRRLVRPAPVARTPEPAPAAPRVRVPRAVAPPVRIILDRASSDPQNGAMPQEPAATLPPADAPEPPPTAAPQPPPAEEEISLPPEADTLLPAPARRPAPPRRSADQAWQVDLPDLAAPLFVRAASLGEAVEIAARHLGRADLAQARAWRIGPLWE